jgi:hypothetical protein
LAVRIAGVFEGSCGGEVVSQEGGGKWGSGSFGMSTGKVETSTVKRVEEN